MTQRRPSMRFGAAILVCAAAALQGAAVRPARAQATDLDLFMKEVLERRDDNWKKLSEYVLEERETLDVRGPGYVPIQGFRREFTWYVRDGILVRSPVTYDGVRLSEDERRRYEDEWLREEEERRARGGRGQDPPSEAPPDETGLRAYQPRFVSEAYFMDLPYEPGNYYLAGRETLEGREVVRIEYYPTHWFDDTDEPDDETGEKIMQQMHKTVMVTLWIVPDEHQIVKYRLDNVGFDFLPFRWLARLTDMQASMVMGQPFAGVWLPREMSIQGAVTLASGTFSIRYVKDYYDYREAEVTSRIRIKAPEGH